MIEFIKNYWKWIILAVVVLIIIIVTKKRKYFWKDKEGNKIGFKEFKTRFKQGVEGITALQISKGQVTGNSINLFGIILGIIVNLVIRIKNQWWWILILLCGSLILMSLSQVTFLQKYWKIKKVNEEINKLNEEQELKEYSKCIICGNECYNGICDCLNEMKGGENE